MSAAYATRAYRAQYICRSVDSLWIRRINTSGRFKYGTYRQRCDTDIANAAAIGVVCGIWSWYLWHDSLATQSLDIGAIEAVRDTISAPSKMTKETMPGRPNTLTEEEAEKLRSMWMQVLHLFGKIDATHEDHGQAEEADVGKTKGKRIRLPFAKKKASDPVQEVTSAADKYGQSQASENIIKMNPPEALWKIFWTMVKHDNPDGLMLRFLRARKWDVDAALTMLLATMQWRDRDMKVDADIIRRGESGALQDSRQDEDSIRKKEGSDFLAQLRMGKSFLHGADREGRPICFVRVRLHKQGQQSESSLERCTVYMLETARLLMNDQIDTAAIVFDMSEFSMANMDYGPVKFMIKCFEANYPESLGVVLVHHSPWVFQGIWKVIKGWLDPVVAAKVHFTKNIDELSHYIDLQQIPSEMGGAEEWTYKYLEPTDDDVALIKQDEPRAELLAKRDEIIRKFEDSTKDWIAKPDDQESQQHRQAAIVELRSNYWKLDGYIRARSFYDRNGMITAK